MSLTTEERDALPSDDFAVPGKRALPIHDATHVKMAWKMVDRTQGLSDEERKDARSKILSKAKSLGISTDDWNAQSMKIEAMAIEMPVVNDHPNRIPFSGILTRLDQPSDMPLGGSMGKLVMLPKAVAEKALPSLLGMAIDFTPMLDGHDSQNKIGLITEANIQGNAIHISGFFYGADFPDEVKCIQANKASLGFSFEAQTRLRSMDDNPLVIDYCVFTGAAVLQKDKAAYTTTALSAKAEKTMTDSQDALIKKIDAMEKQLGELKASNEDLSKKLSAGSVAHKVKEHVDAIRQVASNMEAAGIGMNAKQGHVSILQGMADSMESEAALGKMPNIFHTNDWMSASADKKSETESKEFKELKDSVEGFKTEISDLKKAKLEASSAPERKTLSKDMLNLLEKTGLSANAESQVSLHDLNAALDKTSMKPEQRIALKFNMQASGLIK